MLIAQISDTHILAKSSGRPEARSRAEDLRRCVADINDLDPRPDAAIHTGDATQNGDAAEYAHLREILDVLTMPVYCAPGNRDNRDALRLGFAGGAFQPADPRFLHYVIDDFPVRLVALDSVAAGRPKGAFCDARQRWLETALAARPDRPTILFIHHPPFDLGALYRGGYADPGDASALAEIIGRHGQVRRLLCGHCHRSAHLRWAGSEATTMASVARDLRKGVPTGRHDDAPMYQLHAVAADGSVATATRLVVD